MAQTVDVILIAGVFLFCVMLIKIIVEFRSFKKKLRIINIEIQRNTGKERKRWIRRRRRLWFSLLPFFRY